MNCAKFEKLMALHVEGDLAEKQSRRLAGHLEVCGACREFAAAMRESQSALKSLRLESVEDGVFAQVRAQVFSEVGSPRDVAVWPKYAAAAGLLVLLAAGLVWRHQTPAPPKVEVARFVPAAPTPAQPTVTPVPARQKARLRRPVTREARDALANSQPLVIKMLTDDPQVVIYWLVDQNGG